MTMTVEFWHIDEEHLVARTTVEAVDDMDALRKGCAWYETTPNAAFIPVTEMEALKVFFPEP